MSSVQATRQFTVFKLAVNHTESQKTAKTVLEQVKIPSVLIKIFTEYHGKYPEEVLGFYMETQRIPKFLVDVCILNEGVFKDYVVFPQRNGAIRRQFLPICPREGELFSPQSITQESILSVNNENFSEKTPEWVSRGIFGLVKAIQNLVYGIVYFTNAIGVIVTKDPKEQINHTMLSLSPEDCVKIFSSYDHKALNSYYHDMKALEDLKKDS